VVTGAIRKHTRRPVAANRAYSGPAGWPGAASRLRTGRLKARGL
jgi:hypothetical protein